MRDRRLSDYGDYYIYRLQPELGLSRLKHYCLVAVQPCLSCSGHGPSSTIASLPGMAQVHSDLDPWGIYSTPGLPVLTDSWYLAVSGSFVTPLSIVTRRDFISCHDS